MKTSIKIAFLIVTLIVMNGCSAQKRAERQVRRAVELCPELVQVKAHPIDTVLTAPSWADCTTLPLRAVLSYDTIYAATEHGTVVVSLRQSDSALRVGFVAVPQKLHYQDTVSYAQVVLPAEAPRATASHFWQSFALWLAGIGIGMSLCFYLLRNALRNKH